MDIFLAKQFPKNPKPQHPNYSRPPPSKAPPPSLNQYPQPIANQNAQYAPQNRPHPKVRPPPPPLMPPMREQQARFRPPHPNFDFGGQQNIQTFGNQRIDPNQRPYGSYRGRDNFAYQNRGFKQQVQSYDDQPMQRGRQNYFQQKQNREPQNFNKNGRRNEEEGYYQRRQQNFNNYQTVQHNPNYHKNQSYPRNDFRQSYNKRNQQPGNQQMRQKPINNYEQSEQTQFQRNQNHPRGNYRGRGRGTNRGRNPDRGQGERWRGRGRQMPQQSIQNKKEESVQNESQSANDKSSIIEEQFENQSSNAVSEQQGSDNQVSQSQHQQQISREEEQNQSNQQIQSYQEDEQESRSENKDEEPDMQRIDVMCSREQFQERLQTFRMNNRGRETGLRLDTGRSFAIFEINKRTNEPDISLALKRFRRSTNRGEDQNEKDQTADCPRSRKGLTLTLKHILKQIIDSDGMRQRDLAFPMPPSEKKIEFLHIYDFLWNRMREMIKDVSRLQIRDRDTHEVITICEQMLRFFIIAVKEGRQPHMCKLEFDPKMNIQSITKILTQLLQIYENNHYALSKEPNSNAYISPNQPEITSYAIIISHDLQNTLYQKLRLRVDGLGIGHPLLDCRQVTRALQIKKALKMRDYESFYNILQSCQTDYTQACLLIHHLPTIRRQTLRVLQKSSEIQSSTKNRKIPLWVLQRNLRFSENLGKEFKQFIDHIGVRIVKEMNEPYVILNEFNESLEDHLSSYAFDFPQNKKDRKFYPNSLKKVTMIDSTQVSREQLIKRLWYEASYLQECNSYYLKSKTSSEKSEKKIQKQHLVQIPEISSPLLQEKQYKKVVIDVKQQRQREEIKQDNKNLNFLLQKRKEFNRSKFIKSLEGLIQNLVKKSDVHSQHQKKIGLQMLFQFIEILQIGVMGKGFYRLRQFMQNQRITSQTVNNITQLAIQRNSFLSSFYGASSEFNTFTSGKMFDRLSTKVHNIRLEHNSMITQLREVALKAQTARSQLKILVLFTSSTQNPLSQMQVKFMKHLAEFMTGKLNDLLFSSQVEDLCYLRLPSSKLSVSRNLNGSNEGILFTICFHHYRYDQNESPFFCGFDTVFFVDLQNNSNIFKKTMQEFIDSRKKTMQAILGTCPKLEISFFHLIVASLDKLRYKNTLIGLNQLQSKGSKNLLEEQSLKLSTNLRQSILQAVSSSILKVQKKKQDFQAVAVTNLISQIQQNLTFAQALCKQPISLEQFEKYFIANIKCVSDAIKQTVAYYDDYDWKQILLEVDYLRRPEKSTKLIVPQNQIYYQYQKVNLHSMLSRKLEVSNQVTQLLQQTNFFTRFQAKKRERPYATNFHALAAAIEQYLSALSIQERGGQFEAVPEYVAEHNCTLQFKDNNIKGNSRLLVNYILAQLKKQLMYINILLPSQFKFKIRKDVLVPKPSKKRPTLDNNVMEPKVIEQRQVTKQLCLPKLHYKYQGLLEELNKELQEQNKKENLRMHPAKAIKT